MNQAINYYLTILRNKETARCAFRQAAHQIADLLAQEAANHLKVRTITVQTPLAQASGIVYDDPQVIVPILRSGITMLPSFLRYFCDSRVGVVGLKRDEKTAIAKKYYSNIPPIDAQTQIIIIDPMIATGGTAIETLALLKEKGAIESQILFVSIVSSPEGIKIIKTSYPEVTIITASCDDGLNDKKYIVPGLGDFGDRYFGSE